MSEIRELLHADTAEDRLRAAALSFRSICEHNAGNGLTLTREDGYTLTYRLGAGLELIDAEGELVAGYPESALDDEQWATA